MVKRKRKPMHRQLIGLVVLLVLGGGGFLPLRGAGGLVSYLPVRETNSLTPSSSLTNSIEYTVTVKPTITDPSGEAPTQFTEKFTYSGSDLLIYQKPDPTEHSESYVKNTTLFQGRTLDTETGLYYFRARYLHPELGRFLQGDPKGYVDSMNPYQSFGNNPVNFSDPMGEEIVSAEYGKHDIFRTQRVKTGKWWLDLTVVGMFNELRNTAALAANMGANLLGIGGDVHDKVVAGADKLSAKLGIGHEGDLKDFVQFAEIYSMANASQVSSAWQQLKGYAAPAIENAGIKTASAYQKSRLASEAGQIGELKNTSVASNEKAIVIGEGMERIKESAKSLKAEGINAKWYQAWRKYFTSENFDLEKSLIRNRAWMESKIKAGYKIYDIGPKGKDIASPFYKLELEIIKMFNYPTIPLVK